MSAIAKSRKFGGHTSKQQIYYITKSGNIVYLQSSYEIRYATSLDESNIEWLRPEPLWWTDEKSVEHRYYPDFYLPAYDAYIDTKNDYLIKKDAYKIKQVGNQNNIKLIVLDKDHLIWDLTIIAENRVNT